MELVKNDVNLWYIIRKAVFQRKPIEWRLELLKTQRLKDIKKKKKRRREEQQTNCMRPRLLEGRFKNRWSRGTEDKFECTSQLLRKGYCCPLLCLQIQMQPFFSSVVSLPLTHWVAAVPSSASWMYKRRASGRQIKRGTSHLQVSIDLLHFWLLNSWLQHIKCNQVFFFFSRTPSHHINWGIKGQEIR